MDSTKECPFCGEPSLAPKTEQLTVQVPYGPSVPYDANCLECRACGEQSSTDEYAKEEARQKSILASIPIMLEYLNGEGYSSASIERALRIPQRTTARWKEGEISAAAVALLRVIRTYPWLLKLADVNFREEAAHQLLVGAATIAEPRVFLNGPVAVRGNQFLVSKTSAPQAETKSSGSELIARTVSHQP